MLRLIFHSLRRRRWQSLAAFTGVVLGVGLLLAVWLLYHGLREGLERGRQSLGADLLVVPAGATVDADQALFAGSPLNVYMDKKYADRVRNVPGVRRVEAQFFTQSLHMDCCSLGTEVRLVGIEPGGTRRLAAMSTQGREQIDADEVIVGGRLLNGVGHPGSMMELLGGLFRIGYQLEPSGTSLDYSLFLPIDTARKLAAGSEALKPIWQEYGPPDQLVSALLVEVDDPGKITDVAFAIGELGPLKVIKAAETFQRIKRLLMAFVLVLAGAGLLTAVASAVHLFGHFSSAAWDRKGEWALYRGLGATKLRLAQLVIGESIVLTAAGTLAGLPVGLIFYRLAYARLAADNAFPFVPPPAGVILAALAGAALIYLALGFLAALAPAVRITQLEPASTMAQGDIQ
jgi:putative ABC transport system permease protein